MPRQGGKKVIRRNRRVVNRRRANSKRSTNSQHLKVHRRCAVYPKTKNSTWLDKLSWYGSIALKIFRTIYGVTDTLDPVTAITGSGTTIMLGPGDFASASIAGAQVFTSTDREVVACRAIPFERGTIRRMKIRVVPSVDLGARGGMYAACVVPVDAVDSAIQLGDFVKKFDPNFNSIVKNPSARMAQVTEPLTLHISSRARPTDIRLTAWDATLGWVNAFPQYALMIAYSDLATNTASTETHYAPASSLFEVHLTGDLVLFEPSEIQQATEKPVGMQESTSTLKLFTTDAASLNMSFYEKSWDVRPEHMNLRHLPYRDAERILLHYDRPDLIPKLQLTSTPPSISASMEDLQI